MRAAPSSQRRPTERRYFGACLVMSGAFSGINSSRVKPRVFRAALLAQRISLVCASCRRMHSGMASISWWKSVSEGCIAELSQGTCQLYPERRHGDAQNSPAPD
ncbi:hypothetical protein D3C73_1523160 [compost metagenome]